MKSDWKMAVIGAVGGAVIAVAAVFGLAGYGLLPSAGGDAIGNYLIGHPEILVAMSNKLQMEQQVAQDGARQGAVDKLGQKAFFDPRVAFVTGPADAKTTFVEFFDYNCPYCRASNPTVEKFYNEHKNDARFAFIEFPIKGANSTVAARLAIAARKQPDKYMAFHFALMGEQAEADPAAIVAIAKSVGLDMKKLAADEQDPSVAAAIDAGHALAQAANIDGTPAFIIDGKMREGAIDDAALKAMLSGASGSVPAGGVDTPAGSAG